jgi:5-methylcytosine-specific restriction endonuclease McrA
MPLINLPKKTYKQNKSDKAKDRAKFYNKKQWTKLRLCKLQNEPMCELCKHYDKITPAEDVHHIYGILDRPDLSLDYNNLASLCKECHGKVHNNKNIDNILKELRN